jgi:hypothetical protein
VKYPDFTATLKASVLQGEGEDCVFELSLRAISRAGPMPVPPRAKRRALNYRGFDPVAEGSPRYRAQPPDGGAQPPYENLSGASTMVPERSRRALSHRIIIDRSLLVLSGVDASGVEGPVFSSATGLCYTGPCSC